MQGYGQSSDLSRGQGKFRFQGLGQEVSKEISYGDCIWFNEYITSVSNNGFSVKSS